VYYTKFEPELGYL